MIKSGKNLTKVSKILSHSSTAMTEHVYVHIRRQILKDTVNALIIKIRTKTRHQYYNNNLITNA
jgi:integrase